MSSKDERLCMAIIRNSEVTKIDWAAVAKDFGVETPKVAQCQWYRVKLRFDNAKSTKNSDNNSDIKSDKVNSGKKRGMEEPSASEEGKTARKRPAKNTKRRGRKAKMETPEPEAEEDIVQDDEEV
jgi:hypothetical protein